MKCKSHLWGVIDKCFAGINWSLSTWFAVVESIQHNTSGENSIILESITWLIVFSSLRVIFDVKFAVPSSFRGIPWFVKCLGRAAVFSYWLGWGKNIKHVIWARWGFVVIHVGTTILSPPGVTMGWLLQPPMCLGTESNCLHLCRYLHDLGIKKNELPPV